MHRFESPDSRLFRGPRTWDPTTSIIRGSGSIVEVVWLSYLVGSNQILLRSSEIFWQCLVRHRMQILNSVCKRKSHENLSGPHCSIARIYIWYTAWILSCFNLWTVDGGRRISFSLKPFQTPERVRVSINNTMVLFEVDGSAFTSFTVSCLNYKLLGYKAHPTSPSLEL